MATCEHLRQKTTNINGDLTSAMLRWESTTRRIKNKINNEVSGSVMPMAKRDPPDERVEGTDADPDRAGILDATKTNASIRKPLLGHDIDGGTEFVGDFLGQPCENSARRRSREDL